MLTDTATPSFDVRVPARHARRRRGPSLDWLIVPGLAVVVAVVRLFNYRTAYDVYVDEFFYADMGTSVRDGHMPPLTEGHPFLVHPPGFLFVEALWQAVAGIPADRYAFVFQMRVLQQVFAVATAVLLYALVRRLAGRAPAIVAAVIFALDSYVLRQNGRVLLETATLTFVLAGYLVLFMMVGSRARGTRVKALIAGLLFGYAILVKDMAGGITLVPLLVILVFGCGLPRARTALVAGSALVPYALYALVLTARGLGDDLWYAKTIGVYRLLGLRITTGYNAKGAPSLGSTAIAQALEFGASYAIIGLGALASLYLLVRGPRAEQRILGLFGTSAILMVGYAAGFGTIEEHFLYFLAVPAIAALAVAVASLARASFARASFEASFAHASLARAIFGRARLARRRTIAGILAVSVVLGVPEVVSYVRTRTRLDNGQQQALEWLLHNTPVGTKVAWIAGQTRYEMLGTPLTPVPLGPPEQMAAQGVTHLVTLDKIIKQNYSFASQESIDWYAAHSIKVFSFRSPSYGEVAIYQTIDPNLW